jgi:hypothetical protein
MRIKIAGSLLAMACVVASACLDDSITGTRPLSLSVTVAPSANVNELVTAQYSATGTGLFNLIVDWGDGVVDSLPLSGIVVEISGPVEHTYAVTGSFDITGTVEARNGTISDQAAILVN